MQLDLWKKTFRSEANLSPPRSPPPFNEKQKPLSHGKASASSGEIMSLLGVRGSAPVLQPSGVRLLLGID